MLEESSLVVERQTIEMEGLGFDLWLLQTTFEGLPFVQETLHWWRSRDSEKYDCDIAELARMASDNWTTYACIVGMN